MNENIKVLYVEDNDLTRESFYNILKKRYFSNVVCAANGEEGLKLFDQEEGGFDLVISDIMMPRLNGISMIEKMKDKQSSFCTILISGQDDKKELIKAIELGVNNFILKPVNYLDLDRTLTKAIKYIQATKQLSRIQKEALKSQQLMYEYKKAVDESTIFSIADLKGNIKYANKQFREVSGYSLKELEGKPHSLVRHPDMPKEAFKQMWETIQNKDVWQGMVKNRKKNGEPYYVKATIVPIVDEDGEIFEYAGIRDDITELVKKEQELEGLKDKQRAQEVHKALEIKVDEILAAIPFASIFICAKTNKIKAANTLFEELFLDTQSFKQEPFTNFLVRQEELLYDADIFELYQQFTLGFENSCIALNIDQSIKEFRVGIQQKDEGYILTMIEKGV